MKLNIRCNAQKLMYICYRIVVIFTLNDNQVGVFICPRKQISPTFQLEPWRNLASIYIEKHEGLILKPYSQLFSSSSSNLMQSNVKFREDP